MSKYTLTLTDHAEPDNSEEIEFESFSELMDKLNYEMGVECVNRWYNNIMTGDPVRSYAEYGDFTVRVITKD